MNKYICKKCGQTITSKNPANRSIFFNGRLNDIYITALNSKSCVHIVDDPWRPAGEIMVNWNTRQEEARKEIGKHLEIRITINDNFSWTPKEDIDNPTKALMNYFKWIKELTPEQLKSYVCGATEGHSWEQIENEE